ncbi:3372_t:CDS:2 [Cetraspora pellucida]|uniref:3372_t:CDS:1 n=1 Tax=Cetraspora pellucida TaxID=1433469 RepID=A0A9N9GU15_9GLOM|nr:3372_t:CDS:2 [Cetraspora pellucida]
MLCYTSNHNTGSGKTQYKISDGYLVETSWGRKLRHTIECEIEYDSEGPVFIIRFNKNSQQHVIQLKESSSNVATEYLRKKDSINHARISGIYLFGLNAMNIEQEHEYLKNISITTTNEILHIDDEEIEEEMLKYVRKAGYRKITDILLFVIPDDILNIHRAEFHYMIILYLGNENYEILQKVIEPMINELHNLRLEISEYNFGVQCSKCELLLPLVFVFEEGNWYQGQEQLQTAKPPPGHSKAPLLYMIPLKHYVPDLLHVILRIWDRM